MFHPQGPTLLELARQALSSTESGYDLLAPKFEYTPYRTPDEIVAAVVEKVGSSPRVLDLCCGTGAGMKALRPHCQEIVGIDISEGMLAEGQQLSLDWPGEAKLRWLRGDALALPFCQEFDAVVCFGAFGHILPEQEAQLVDNIYRALRPGGRFVFVTSQMPGLHTLRYWRSRGFNAVMRVRNLLWRPPFIMYYLTFLLPRATRLLQARGFEVQSD
ncbi:MAG: class I SAM-dependent methyltransferase, partial [Candidatus Eremiobacteraeota bacterium]|nr:class I SAM-dependent methyltransferase [Candidatus Eremiobacteraeota bacterium]